MEIEMEMDGGLDEEWSADEGLDEVWDACDDGAAQAQAASDQSVSVPPTGHAPPDGGTGVAGTDAEQGPAEAAAPVPSSVGSSVGMRLAVGIKAGMERVDHNHVNAVIAEVSEGSAFWKNEERKEERTTEKTEKMLQKRAEITASGALQSPATIRDVDSVVAEFERGRDLSRCIVHVDMDSFYAAVEERDNPALCGKPMAVGGIGMLSTSNYVARRFGVRAAMPGYIGKKLCPELLIVKPRYSAYKEASERVHDVLLRWDAGVCQVGMDEAFLDMTRHAFEQPRPDEDVSTAASQGAAAAAAAARPAPDTSTSTPASSETHWGEATCLARVEAAIAKMRAEISEATGGLTASAGIGPNRMIAKIASDMRKPDGQFLVLPTKEAVLAFIEPLAVRKVGGIGKVTASILDRLGITECHHLFAERRLLSLLFSRSSFRFFVRSSLGIASTTSAGVAFAEPSAAGRKSISTERTFGNMSDPAKLRQKCRELCASLASDVAKHNLEGRNMGLKLKTVGFTVISRASTLPAHVSTAAQLEAAALAILNKELLQAEEGLHLRLMGVRLSALRIVGSGAAPKPSGGLHRFLETKKPISVDFQEEHPSAEPTVPVAAVGDHEAMLAGHAAEPGGAMEERRICPVCQSVLESSCDANDHIDNCLSKRAIREMLKDPVGPTHRPKKKARTKGPLDGFLQRPS